MHACMLEEMPKAPCIAPMSSIWRKLRQGGKCFLPCSWHHASKLYLSQKGLRLERERQLNSGCCLVIHPYSPFKFYWDVYIMIVYTCSLIYLPLQVFFHCPNPYDPLVLFVDAMGFLYIIFNFCIGTTGEDGKNVNLQRGKIVKIYMKDTFIIDVISALPLQTISGIPNCRFPTHTLMFLFKLLRIVACRRVLNSLFQQFEITYLWSSTIMLFASTVVFFHWMTYVHYQTPVYFAHMYWDDPKMKQWLVRYKVQGPDGQPVWPPDKYISNLYLVTGLCIGAGFYGVDEMIDQISAEHLSTAILSLFGLTYDTYLTITMARLVMYNNRESYTYSGLKHELEEYLELKRVPHRLRQKIQLYINYRFNGHYFDQAAILNTLNVKIKQEINMHCCKKLVGNVPLFQDMPIALINTIIFGLQQVLYMPGEIVVRCGHPGSSIYLIASGTVAIMDANGKEVGHLKDGAFFGEKALLRPGTQRTATIIALEITEIYKLNHYQFRLALQPCPRLKRRLLREYTTPAPPAPGSPGQQGEQGAPGEQGQQGEQ